MKNYLFPLGFIFLAAGASAQTKEHKLGITSGAYIQHYNGDLGNSLFKFNTCCFAGEVLTLGYYLDRTFDFNFSASIGDYGYCQTAVQANKVIPISDRCPGCKDRIGMGELRARMFSGNIALKYKFANGITLKEDSKISPYLYAGMGINYLRDQMKRQCVSVGTHFSINAGVGVKYNINERFNVGYNLGAGCFTKDKVYATTGNSEVMEMTGKRDMYMQNTLFVGVNLF